MEIKNKYLNPRIEIEKLLEIYESSESFSKDEVLQLIINYTSEVVNDPKVMYIATIDYQEDNRLSRGCCPHCNNPLIKESYNEGRDECYEPMFYDLCTECNWSNING